MNPQKIWKFPLKLQSSQVIEIPRLIKMLDVQVQDHRLCMWCLVDPDAYTARRLVYIAGTGERLPWKEGHTGPPMFVGTVQRNGYVWHVFLDSVQQVDVVQEAKMIDCLAEEDAE